MAKNTGKPSEEDFTDSLNLVGKKAWWYRIKDAAAIRGLTGKIGHVDKTPSDYVVVAYGLTAFCEVKSTQNETSFPFGLLKTGQVSHGIRILAAGGAYLVFVQRLPSLEWYVVPLCQINRVKSQGKQSIPWEALEKYRWNLKWPVTIPTS